MVGRCRKSRYIALSNIHALLISPEIYDKEMAINFLHDRFYVYTKIRGVNTPLRALVSKKIQFSQNFDL